MFNSLVGLPSGDVGRHHDWQVKLGCDRSYACNLRHIFLPAYKKLKCML